MGWAAIISLIIDILEPILTGWLKDWLNNRLQKAAARFAGDAIKTTAKTAASAAEIHAATAKVFDAAISELRPIQFLQRGFFRRAKRVVLAHLSGKDLEEAKAELEDTMLSVMTSKALFLRDAE